MCIRDSTHPGREGQSPRLPQQNQDDHHHLPHRGKTPQPVTLRSPPDLAKSPKFFDSVPWDLMIQAVQANITTDQRWVQLYVKRWLQAPLALPDGTVQDRNRGTPQGALCSATHKPPYAQCRVMRSDGVSVLVGAGLAVERYA